MRQGYSNKEASRLVGVHERTGREWRNGRTDPNRFRAPARPERAPAAVSGPSRYLREDERRPRPKSGKIALNPELRREPAGALRSGRARRKPQRQANCRQPRFTARWS